MYAPSVIAAREAALVATPGFREQFPDGTIPWFSIDEARQRTAALLALYDPDTDRLSRRLTPDESRFVGASKFRITFDFPYFAERWAYIDQEGYGIRPLYPLWESQRYLLDRLADLESARYTDPLADGLLLNILKIRQVGISTLAEILVGHRLLTRAFVRGLCGSDVEEQAGYLFRMVERLYTQLPFFLRPGRAVPWTKDRELTLTNGSSLRAAYGKSTRGALQKNTGQEGIKGHIGRGRTYAAIHISELATWDNPDQLDTALFPGIPRSPVALALLESTAERAGDWWHHHWQASARSVGRFVNLFIGSYAVPSKYSLTPPAHWEPTDSTKAWLEKAEKESPQWCFGRTIRPTAAQAYWYESTRAYYMEKGKLADFLKEYPSDPEECFQYAGQSAFTHEQLAEIDRHACRPLIDVWEVKPALDVAAARRREAAAIEDAPEPDLRPSRWRRPDPPLTPAIPASPVAADLFPVPSGYGFRRLPPRELQSMTERSSDPHVQFANALAIWEHPRRLGPRRYIVGVDVADGVGLDYSVITVVRQATLDDIAEDVAQYLSNTVNTQQLAYIVEAIGRLYTDQDGLEALVAIECNNHGLAVQDLLQLHMGYTHFYVWEYSNAAQPEKRWSTKIGWYTNTSTRPHLLSLFHGATTTTDPITDRPDLRLNSPVTRQELRHFVIPPDPYATLKDAEHAIGQHDDAIFSTAIGYVVAYHQAGGELEPVAERRRRKAALAAFQHQAGQPVPDYRNTATTADEASAHFEDDDDEFADTPSSLYFSSRGSE